MGFPGDPVAPLSRSAANTKANSYTGSTVPGLGLDDMPPFPELAA
jgi:hypothetical protein